MENYCINCQSFKIWEKDPCCLHREGWKIVLPSMTCKKYKKENSNLKLEQNLKMWNDCKHNFLKNLQIKRKDLIDDYIQLFPEDEKLIKS